MQGLRQKPIGASMCFWPSGC